MAAWNAGDLRGWLELHHADAEYLTLAGDEPRVYAGHDGLERAWAESRANWREFSFTVAGQQDGAVAVDFRGEGRLPGVRAEGRLWFVAQERDGLIAALRSGPEPGLL